MLGRIQPEAEVMIRMAMPRRPWPGRMLSRGGRRIVQMTRVRHGRSERARL
ncbi:MAG: hypothetical protein U9R79_21345 [Armatimonadota bacterium]|nr:hypothetical protein [Armatimonadota bacterium]